MKLWTTDIAYAIGLITTDGNLSKDKRHIALTSTDKQLLKTFQKCLSLKNKICINPPGGYSKNKCYKITFGNVIFYDWLLKIGLKPNKTVGLLRLKIPDKYLPDFLRGHIDGDGSIIHYIDRHNEYKGKIYTYNRLYITFRSSSSIHIRWLRQNIRRILNINGSLSGWKDRRRNNKKILWALRFCKRESLILLKYLYYSPNLPCLLRKKKIAENFLRIISQKPVVARP